MPAVSHHPAGPVPVIFDTDMCGDCDDAGALAVLHHLADAGEATILACVVNSRDEDRAAGAAVSAVNTYHRRPDIPLGAYHGDHSKRLKSAYTAALRDEFPHAAPADDLLPSALALYRRTLAAAADGSVVIISIGFLTVLHELLVSGPDADSPLDGLELARRKVRRLVVMGGAFPRSEAGKPEFNFANAENDGQDAFHVVDHWPTAVLFTGWEIGAAIRTGTALAAAPRGNPVRRAYELYPVEGGQALSAGRPSWDHTAVLAAVRDPEAYWQLVGGGRCVVATDGGNHWESAPTGGHAYLAVRTPPDELARLIDSLMTAAPAATG